MIEDAMKYAKKIEFVGVNHVVIRLDDVSAVSLPTVKSPVKACVILKSGFKIVFDELSDNTIRELNYMLELLTGNRSYTSNHNEINYSDYDRSNSFNLQYYNRDSNHEVEDLPF